MARTKGTLSLPFNIEPEIAAPVDARFIVNELADLTLAITWTANDGNVYAYKGMIVSVHSDATPINNGIYQLQDVDYTNINNWVKSSSGGVTDHALLDATSLEIANSGHLYSAPGSSIIREFNKVFEERGLSLKDFGAKGDYVYYNNSGATISKGSDILTVKGNLFTPTDVGKLIFLPYSGASHTAHITTITEFISANSIRIADPAIEATMSWPNQGGDWNVDGTQIEEYSPIAFGTDDTTAIELAFSYLNTESSIANLLFIPIGGYITTKQINIYTSGKSIIGEGAQSVYKKTNEDFYGKRLTHASVFVWFGKDEVSTVFRAHSVIGVTNPDPASWPAQVRHVTLDKFGIIGNPCIDTTIGDYGAGYGFHLSGINGLQVGKLSAFGCKRMLYRLTCESTHLATADVPLAYRSGNGLQDFNIKNLIGGGTCIGLNIGGWPHNGDFDDPGNLPTACTAYNNARNPFLNVANDYYFMGTSDVGVGDFGKIRLWCQNPTAVIWESGKNYFSIMDLYPLGDKLANNAQFVFDPTDQLIYKCINTVNNSTVSPKDDPTNFVFYYKPREIVRFIFCDQISIDVLETQFSPSGTITALSETYTIATHQDMGIRHGGAYGRYYKPNGQSNLDWCTWAGAISINKILCPFTIHPGDGENQYRGADACAFQNMDSGDGMLYPGVKEPAGWYKKFGRYINNYFIGELGEFYGIKSQTEIDMVTSGIIGVEQVLGYNGNITLSPGYGINYMGFLTADPSLTEAGFFQGQRFTITNSIYDNNNTFTIERILGGDVTPALNRDVQSDGIISQPTEYGILTSDTPLMIRNQETITVTIPPVYYPENWKLSVMKLEPWMSAYPLTIAPPRLTNRAIHGSIIIKQNSVGDGVFAGLHTDTQNIVTYKGGSVSINDSIVLNPDEILYIDLIYSPALGKYILDVRQEFGLIIDDTNTQNSPLTVVNNIDNNSSANNTAITSFTQLLSGSIQKLHGYYATVISESGTDVTGLATAFYSTLGGIKGHVTYGAALTAEVGAPPDVDYLYGLIVQGVTSGNIANYAIHTKEGQVSFGDDVEINGSEYVDGKIDEVQRTTRGVPGQTANLEEWKNASDTVLASVDKDGNFVGSGSKLTGISVLNPVTYSSGTISEKSGTVIFVTGNLNLPANPSVTGDYTLLFIANSSYTLTPSGGSKIQDYSGTILPFGAAITLVPNHTIQLTYIYGTWNMTGTGVHRIKDHTDIASTGAQVDSAVTASHAELHTIASHTDITATGSQIDNVALPTSTGKNLHTHAIDDFSVVGDGAFFYYSGTGWNTITDIWRATPSENGPSFSNWNNTTGLVTLAVGKYYISYYMSVTIPADGAETIQVAVIVNGSLLAGSFSVNKGVPASTTRSLSIAKFPFEVITTPKTVGLQIQSSLGSGGTFQIEPWTAGFTIERRD